MPETASGDRSAHPVRVLPVPKGHGVVVIFAGPIEGCLSHWHQGRSLLCPGPEECAPSIHRGRTLWKGFAPVRHWNPHSETWRPAVLEVTEHLEEELHGRQLIGEVWFLQRAGTGKKSDPVQGSFLERRDDRTLTAPFSVMPALNRMYHCAEIRFGIPNPVPRKMLLPEIAAAGPELPAEAAAPEPSKPTGEQLKKLREFARDTRPVRRTGPPPAPPPAEQPNRNGAAH